MHQFGWLLERGGLFFKFASEGGGTKKGDSLRKRCVCCVCVCVCVYVCVWVWVWEGVGFQPWKKLCMYFVNSVIHEFATAQTNERTLVLLF